jgi:hypothetical protein
MPDDGFDFSVKAISFQGILKNALTKDLPSRRELDIQVDKLGRMAAEFTKRFGLKAILSTPPAKLRKQKGPYLHRLTQQSRHVDTLMAKMMTELFLTNEEFAKWPAKHKKRLPLLSRKFVHQLNRNYHKVTQQMRLEAVASTSKASLKAFYGE